MAAMNHSKFSRHKLIAVMSIPYFVLLSHMTFLQLRDAEMDYRERKLLIDLSIARQAVLLAEIVEEAKGARLKHVESRLFFRLHSMCMGRTEPDYVQRQWEWYDEGLVEWTLPDPNVDIDSSAEISQLSLFHAEHPEVDVPSCAKAFLEP